METDLSGFLELLDESLVKSNDSRCEVVCGDGETPRSRVDRILSSELKEKSSGGANKRQLCDVDANVSSGIPLKIVVCQLC